jgi:hypothetical protein
MPLLDISSESPRKKMPPLPPPPGSLEDLLAQGGQVVSPLPLATVPTPPASQAGPTAQPVTPSATFDELHKRELEEEAKQNLTQKVVPELTVPRLGGAALEGAKDVARETLGVPQMIRDFAQKHPVAEKIAEALPVVGYMVQATRRAGQLLETTGAEKPVMEALKTAPEYAGESSGFVEDVVRNIPQIAETFATGLGVGGIVRKHITNQLTKAAAQKGAALTLSEAQDVAEKIGFKALTKAAEAGGGAAMFHQIAGGDYQRFKEQGVDPDRAMVAALFDASVQTPMESWGIGKVLKAWRPGRPIGQKVVDFLGAVGSQWAQEFMQQFPQDFAEIWAGEPSESNWKALGKFVENIPQTVKEGAYAGLVVAPFAALGAAGGFARRGTAETASTPTSTPKPATTTIPTPEQTAQAEARYKTDTLDRIRVDLAAGKREDKPFTVDHVIELAKSDNAKRLGIVDDLNKIVIDYKAAQMGDVPQPSMQEKLLAKAREMRAAREMEAARRALLGETPAAGTPERPTPSGGQILELGETPPAGTAGRPTPSGGEVETLAPPRGATQNRLLERARQIREAKEARATEAARLGVTPAAGAPQRPTPSGAVQLGETQAAGVPGRETESGGQVVSGSFANKILANRRRGELRAQGVQADVIPVKGGYAVVIPKTAVAPRSGAAPVETLPVPTARPEIPGVFQRAREKALQGRPTPPTMQDRLLERAKQIKEQPVPPRAATPPAAQPAPVPATQGQVLPESGAGKAPVVPTTTFISDHPVVELPVSDLKLSETVPNFKEAANRQGVVEPLTGKYERLGTGPIVVWERKDGSLEVITGRHRLDLSKRTGEKTIPAQVVKESEGFTKAMAITLDAEANIRDNQGGVRDYANYFRHVEITEEEASSRGLLARDPGRKGFRIGKDASPNLYTGYREGKISEAKTVAIAEAAPKNEELQMVGMKYAANHDATETANYLRAIQTIVPESTGMQLGLFGKNEEWQIEADKMGKAASRMIGDLETERTALKSAERLGKDKFKEIAKRYGIKAGDTEAIENRLHELDRELLALKGWPTNPDLVAKIREAAGLKAKQTVTAESKVPTPEAKNEEAEPSVPEPAVTAPTPETPKTKETEKGTALYAATTRASDMVTIADIRDAFRGQEVGILPNVGMVYVKTKGGQYLFIESVDNVSVDEMALNAAYGRELKPTEVVGGKYHNGTITLRRVGGGRWVLAHESTHWMEDVGIINKMDVAMLRAHIRGLARDGKWQTVNAKDIGGAEDRANWLATAQTQEAPTGIIGRILAKIREWIDRMVNLFHRTPGGLVRDIQTGRIFGEGVQGTETEEEYAIQQGLFGGETVIPEGKKKVGKGQDARQLGLGLSVPGAKLGAMPNVKARKSGEGLGELGKVAEAEAQKAFEEKTGKLGEIGSTQNIMGKPATLAEKKTVDEVDWLLYRNQDGTGAVELYDPDSEQMVEVTKYPSFEAASKYYREEGKNKGPASAQYSIIPAAAQEEIRLDRDAALKTLASYLPKQLPHNTFLENMLKSAEWWDHPVVKRIVRAGIDRTDKFHDLFNDINTAEAPFQEHDTVTDATQALKAKGMSRTDLLRGKTSKEYKQLKDMIESGDTDWVRRPDAPLADEMRRYEDHWREKGVGEDVISVWRLHRASYDKALDRLLAPLKKMLERTQEGAVFQGEKLDSADIKDFLTVDGKPISLKQLINIMDEWHGFYAPRVREPGDWVVRGQKGPGPSARQIRVHRATRFGAERLAAKLRSDGWDIQPVHELRKLPEEVYGHLNLISTQQLFNRALEGVRAQDLDVAAKLHDEILQQVADLVRARGYRSTMIHRKRGRGPEVVAGYVEDPLDRFVTHIRNVSAGLAKADAAHQMITTLNGEWKYNPETRKSDKVGGIDAATEPRAFKAAQRYIEEQLRNLDASDRMIGTAKAVASLKYLGLPNVRAPFVNLTALLTTAPAAIHEYVTGGKTAMPKVLAELGRSTKDYMRFMAGRRGGFTLDELAFLDEAKARGYEQPQYTRDAMGAIESLHGKAWTNLMRGAMWGFGKTEQLNRGATLLAGYRLAKRAGSNETVARDLARDGVEKAHGVYGRATLPSWAMGGSPTAKIGQMAYTYQKFGHNWLQMMYDLGMKRHNITALLWALGTPILLGGAAATPLKGLMAGIIGSIMRAMGDDRDPEDMMWDQIRKALGPGGERIARYGLVGAAGGNIAGSFSVDPGVPKNLVDLTGAIGGVMGDLSQAWKYLETGQPGRALETAAPTGVSNVFRAIRELRGATTREGRPVWDENGQPYVPGAGETALRVAGFTSARRSTAQARQWEAKKTIGNYQERRDGIYEQFRAYLADPTPERLETVMARIMRYNEGIMEHDLAGVVPLINRESLTRQIRSTLVPSKAMRMELRE